ncbi:MAG TPA: Calx-beta domain-containing protein [Pyrinomonadaceae bacterium]
MKFAKDGVRSGIKTLLALAVAINLLALPGLGRAARAAGDTRSDVKIKTPAGSSPSHSTYTQSTQEQDAKQAAEVLPRRGRIAFASDRDGNFEIYVMSADGGGLTRITDNAADDLSPVWSADGNRLAFVSYRDGNAEIYAINSDGSNLARLTDNPADDLDPAWSPDGARIAFTSGRDNTDEIYVMNADGSSPVNLSNNREGDDVQPAWSPTGTSIAFASNRDENYEIYVMNADGGNQRNLTNNPATDSNPTWSPMRITFQSDRDSPPNEPETNFEIYSINATNGGGLTRLTDSADNPATVLNESFDIAPSRSFESGAMIAFASTRDGDFEIYTSSPDGTTPKQLTNNDEANDIEPAVQPLQTAAEAQGSLQFSAANYSVSEGAGSFTVTVTRTGVTTGTARVDFNTSSGTASERSDFISALGTLMFAAGETSRTFTILITDDALVEFDETITISLDNPTGASLGTPNTVTLTITDNDTTPAAANPIDNSEFFVRQHYRDFLNRDPEASGLAAWLAVLNRCNGGFRGSDPSCDRITVSASFFLSPEFQSEGYFTIRFYLASLGRLPRFVEFQQDLTRLNAQTAAETDANRAGFTDEFVQREEFRMRYDSLSNAAYVDALAQTAGVTLTNRDQLVSDLNTGRKTRSQVLREIVDSQAFAGRRSVFNQAFVLSQYFGYLRRDPDAGGFQNWLTYLNNNPGDFRTMVNGFVNSVEYRARFGRP